MNSSIVTLVRLYQPCAMMRSREPGSIEVALFADDDPFTAGDCTAFEEDNVDVLAFVDACISRL